MSEPWVRNSYSSAPFLLVLLTISRFCDLWQFWHSCLSFFEDFTWLHFLYLFQFSLVPWFLCCWGPIIPTFLCWTGQHFSSQFQCSRWLDLCGAFLSLSLIACYVGLFSTVTTTALPRTFSSSNLLSWVPLVMYGDLPVPVTNLPSLVIY